MAKQIDYPRATLKNSLDLARAIDGLGGNSSIEMAAEALNKKVSGAFQALVSSTVKYGLISSKQGQLETTQLFRNHKLAYSDREAAAVLSEAFLNIPLFRAICVRFENKSLPVNHFEKLLVREFDVPDQMGSRVAKYFLDGAKQCGLLGPDHTVRTSQNIGVAGDDGSDDDGSVDEVSVNESSFGINESPFAVPPHETTRAKQSPVDQPAIARSTEYSVRITGPGMDSVIAIHDEEDLLIVRAMLKKIEKKLVAHSDESEQ